MIELRQILEENSGASTRLYIMKGLVIQDHVIFDHVTCVPASPGVGPGPSRGLAGRSSVWGRIPSHLFNYTLSLL